MDDLFTAAQRFIPRRDPLTLDLDGDGIETVPPSSTDPILFDHIGDGIKTGTGWIKPDDGFLVLDRDGNGTIDSGRELFGDSTPIFDADGLETGKAEDGFAALAQEDSNGDGVVNAQDTRFGDLRVWQDLNQDGISQVGELKTLAELGIAAINVGKTEYSRILPGGNEIADLGTYTRTDGTTGSAGTTSGLADVNLAADTFHRSFTDTIPSTPETEALPDMQGSGVVRDLREAASLSSEVTGLLTQYSQSTTRAEQLGQLDALIEAWGATSGMADMATRAAEHGYGFSTNLDALHQARLTALEQFNGRGFYRLPWEPQTGQSGVTGMSITTDANGDPLIRIDMNGSQIALLDRAWEALRQSVYEGLLLQTRLKPYLDAASLTVSDTGIGMDFAGTASVFQTRYEEAPGEAVRDLLDLQRIAGTNLNGLGWDGYGQLRGGLLDTASSADPALTATLVSALADFGYPGLRVNGDGTDGSEAVIGDDAGAVLNGGAGNDLILGAAGDDVLNGGTGSDTLYGGSGNDTYVFNLGDGADTIIETHGDTGTDTLEFGPGILAGDITLAQEGDKLAFAHSNGRDRVSIANWFDSLSDVAHRLDTARFADGRSFDLASLQLGTANADILIGTTANDILVGQAGDDALSGDAGDDVLDGGAGTDSLVGGAGDDTYVVDNTSDLVTEYSGEGTDLVQASVTYTLTDNVENLTLTGTGDLSGTGNALDNRIVGNKGNNVLNGLAGSDTLIGDAGNDLLDCGAGADTLAGGAGDDTYIVDEAGDTVTELAGEGIDTVQAGIDYVLSDNVENLTLTGTGNIDGTGNALAMC